MPKRKFSCGDVCFRNSDGYVMLMGTSRIDALKKFYNREDMGNLEPFAFGFGTLKHENVNWETCGEEITQGRKNNGYENIPGSIRSGAPDRGRFRS
jgi:hypothetical protein